MSKLSSKGLTSCFFSIAPAGDHEYDNLSLRVRRFYSSAKHTNDRMRRCSDLLERQSKFMSFHKPVNHLQQLIGHPFNLKRLVHAVSALVAFANLFRQIIVLMSAFALPQTQKTSCLFIPTQKRSHKCSVRLKFRHPSHDDPSPAKKSQSVPSRLVPLKQVRCYTETTQPTRRTFLTCKGAEKRIEELCSW